MLNFLQTFQKLSIFPNEKFWPSRKKTPRPALRSALAKCKKSLKSCVFFNFSFKVYVLCVRARSARASAPRGRGGVWGALPPRPARRRRKIFLRGVIFPNFFKQNVVSNEESKTTLNRFLIISTAPNTQNSRQMQKTHAKRS